MIRKNIVFLLFSSCLLGFGQVGQEDFVLQDGVLIKYTGVESAVIIPDNLGITEIGERAFAFSKVTSVTIPAGVSRIGNWGFWGSEGLANIQLPEGLTHIGDWAFLGCSSLQTLRFPDTLISIGDWTFGNCPNLTSIEVSEENTAYRSIEGVLFDKTGTILAVYPGGNQNPSYTIPDQVELIRNLAFSSAVNLVTVRIPPSVIYIGNLAFYGCPSLTSIEAAEENPGYRSIEGVLFDKTGAILLAYPEGNKNPTYTIPLGVQTIGERAFYGCTGFSRINIPKSVTTIGQEAFQECTGLVNMQIPDNITAIGDRAFSYCTSLVAVNISSKVTSIGNQAFYGCTNLELIHLYRETRMGKDVFESVPGQLTYLD
ncbi:MAG: leucine-rich repeat domain-containing protein [Treponema sp.]|jgi:hypothetical protein|nr:leucine-rich repeat domain-containing protein [Treponema sp.]